LNKGLAILWIATALGLVAGEVRPARTLANLQLAHRGETNARATYEGCAKKAEVEGYLGVAALFRASAIAEGVHAEAHLAALRKLGAVTRIELKPRPVLSTKENLENAIKEEALEETSLYPAFIRVAREEGHKAALQSFTFAKNAEREHKSLYAEALNDLEGWRLQRAFLVCTLCGYTVPKIALERCSFCAGGKKSLLEVQ